MGVHDSLAFAHFICFNLAWMDGVAWRGVMWCLLEHFGGFAYACIYICIGGYGAFTYTDCYYAVLLLILFFKWSYDEVLFIPRFHGRVERSTGRSAREVVWCGVVWRKGSTHDERMRARAPDERGRYLQRNKDNNCFNSLCTLISVSVSVIFHPTCLHHIHIVISLFTLATITH